MPFSVGFQKFVDEKIFFFNFINFYAVIHMSIWKCSAKAPMRFQPTKQTNYFGQWKRYFLFNVQRSTWNVERRSREYKNVFFWKWGNRHQIGTVQCSQIPHVPCEFKRKLKRFLLIHFDWKPNAKSCGLQTQTLLTHSALSTAVNCSDYIVLIHIFTTIFFCFCSHLIIMNHEPVYIYIYVCMSFTANDCPIQLKYTITTSTVMINNNAIL